jgi:hypothetical protein
MEHVDRRVTLPSLRSHYTRDAKRKKEQSHSLKGVYQCVIQYVQAQQYYFADRPLSEI